MIEVKRVLIAGLIAAVITVALQADAKAQYPIAIEPVVPAVVGYSAERRGFFGQRVVVRPVVAAVSARPAVVVARPAVTAYYAPPVARVTAYYAPPAVTAVTTYRVPVVTTYRVPVVTTYRVPYSSYMIAY